MGWYCKAGQVEAERFEGEVDDEYDEASDTYYLKEQWVDESMESEYHYSISGVTHWMPLPDLPSNVELTGSHVKADEEGAAAVGCPR